MIPVKLPEELQHLGEPKKKAYTIDINADLLTPEIRRKRAEALRIDTQAFYYKELAGQTISEQVEDRQITREYDVNGGIISQKSFIENKDGMFVLDGLQVERRKEKAGERLVASHYLCGVVHGVTKAFNVDGVVVREEMYLQGKLVDVATNYYEDGNVRQRSTFVDDIQHGPMYSYNTKGVLVEESEWVDGRPDGFIKGYTDTGILESVVEFKAGKQEGMSLAYFPDGTLMLEAVFVDGLRHGITKIYNEQGNLILEKIYRNDILIGPDHLIPPLIKALGEKETTESELINLIHSGADVNAVADDDGFSPIILASLYDYSAALISELINAGANVNAVANEGSTALIAAGMNNSHPDVIEELIKAGADVTARNRLGCTALMLAVGENTNPDVAVALIKGGSDINARDYAGDSVKNYQEYPNMHQSVMDLLEE